MKAVPLRGGLPCLPEEAESLRLNVPGTGVIVLPVLVGNATRNGTGKWSWNGDAEKVTLRPSVLSEGTHRSHSWITDGKVHFLEDGNTGMEGSVVDLLDVKPEEFEDA